MWRDKLAVFVAAAALLTTQVTCKNFGPSGGGGDGGYDGPIVSAPVAGEYGVRLVGNGYGRVRFTGAHLTVPVKCDLRGGVVFQNGEPRFALGGSDVCTLVTHPFIPSSEPILLEAEPAWFSSFDGWSGQCEVLSARTCRAELGRSGGSPGASASGAAGGPGNRTGRRTSCNPAG
jgi:hypothetical protein